MRVVVVGASGNVGTSVLEALAAEESVTEVVGLARRLPDERTAPYSGVDWRRIDLATSPAELQPRLREVFEGADTVVHLAWAIQPNHQRDYMRRVNVEGTRLVAEAAAAAQVQHLVVASSWAVYSPVPDGGLRDETASRDGIPSSHYSVDKAAQERVLDEVEAAHPAMVVTRMRTALVFRPDAGAAIGRYFLGPFVPRSLLRPGRIPILPLPRGLRLQVVHGHDVGRAYAAVVRHRAGGAFNVAAPETLRAPQLAEILDHGRHVEVPAAVLRPLLHYGWRARLLAPDAGWLDMAMNVPVMDTARIRELGWRAERSAAETVHEMATGVADLSGAASPPMRPRERSFGGPVESLVPARTEARTSLGRSGPRELPAEAFDARVPDHIDGGLLGLYLADHLAGATAGRERARRMASDLADGPLGPDLARFSADLTRERELLRELIHVLGLHPRPFRAALGWLAERLGRAKANRHVVSTSPTTPLLEIELMFSVVHGKLGLWRTLQTLSADLNLPQEVFDELAEHAREQARTLERLHERVSPDAWSSSQ
ncbi:NAD-dependent epimerase/dehydratase family protein [Ruania suaedae]|uniref:NAD-dependent epimerase/dehydratase family protein n=1 Tax=Ruania suaedae TaxID=2897774 RepID=UPI001E4DF1F0|nr:NAD-dependent epimerase/dehydratase family protein [Ruania suaedae]UFU03666.1 NAD-dependent epimerase/dehydratase family protein [Ruania suaedae]